MDATSFYVGATVRYYQVGTLRHGNGGGWRFGEIIGRHRDDIGADATGLEMATVRFPSLNTYFPAVDQAIPLFRLEVCEHVTRDEADAIRFARGRCAVAGWNRE